MNPNKLLKVATYAGKILLQSGAETYRVEETVVRICKAFDIDDAESFVTPTGIMSSITKDNQIYSFVNRIPARGTDLGKIDAINHLSREVQKHEMDLDELQERLDAINQGKRYGYLTTLFFSALSAFGFAIFFQGNSFDACAAFVAGLVIKVVSHFFEQMKLNTFFNISISAGVGAFISIMLFHFDFVHNIDITIISSIMLLVPGLALTNAIRDIVAGDLVSGLTRISEAFLVAIAIAVGTGAILSVFGGLLI